MSPSFDTVTVKLINTIDLPLLGGTRVKTTMAANKQYLFIGTNKSPFAVRVQKRNLDVIQVGFSPPINVSAITSDQYGYVTVTFGTVSGESGFYLFGPDGNLQEDGVVLISCWALHKVSPPRTPEQPAHHRLHA